MKSCESCLIYISLVNIIAPSYNCKKYYKETYESVINQTYKDCSES